MRIPGYRIESELGSGGMSTVYKGVQLSLQRPVAIKVLKHDLADHDEIRQRFEKEAIIIARLNHPNVIQVIDQGLLEEQTPYFVMEYIKGVSLRQAISRQLVSHNRALDLFQQIAKGLAYAHKNDIVHCDIKPDNILVDFEGVVKILDFGIAKIFSESDGDEEFILGSPKYMAPEQELSIAHATNKSDIFALGVIMYCYFCRFFPEPNGPRVIDCNKNIPQELDELIMKCLEQDPQARPESAEFVKNALLRALNGNHLGEKQQQKARRDVKESFNLLDSIKDDKHGAVYLFEKDSGKQSNTNNPLYIIKKKPTGSSGQIEAKRLSTLQHTNIVNIYGTSSNRSSFIIVMEYCGGGSLAERMLRKFSLNEFLPLAKDIASGLRFAHNHGVIHGNLRPSNILLDDEGHAKLADFGLDEHYLKSRNNWYAVLGQHKSKIADIYALGVIYYQLLTGELPVFKNNILQLTRKAKKLPRTLQALLQKMLIKDESQRLANIDIVENILSRMQEDQATTVRPTSAAANTETQIESNSHPRRLRRFALFSIAASIALGIQFWWLASLR